MLQRAFLNLNKTMLITPRFFIKIIITAIIFFPIAGHTFDPKTNTLLDFLKTEHAPPLPLLPDSLTITNTFKPSTHPFAGTVTSLRGTAYVYHKNGNIAYSIKENHPIFSGDTLVTAENTSVTLHLADDSVLIIMARSKLLIDKSLPRMKIRDTTMQLFFGTIRSLVKKISGEYTIKTPTATLGVRGTDFVVAVAPAQKNKQPRWKTKIPAGLLTAILTGGKQSTVELTGFFGPSVMVKPLSVAAVRTGSPAEQAVYIGPTAIPLLEKIAPHGKTEPIPTVAPCWTFSVKANGSVKKEYLKACKPVQKPAIIRSQKLWPEAQ
ncbi:MAG: hypothetical protein D3925_06415 [Candidatus Electrothrix sp. AR5]|nr:hypothetical protein [Candidatus Electrothrix sp. AR5]